MRLFEALLHKFLPVRLEIVQSSRKQGGTAGMRSGTKWQLPVTLCDAIGLARNLLYYRQAREGFYISAFNEECCSRWQSRRTELRPFGGRQSQLAAFLFLSAFLNARAE